MIEKNSKLVKTYQGNAIDLSAFQDESFDLVLLLGPMYHLCNEEDKIKALNEAKRIVKRNGIIMVAYCMNDYAVLTYAFKENHILECIDHHMLSEDFHCLEKATDLYSYVRLDDITRFNQLSNLKRIKIITPDGPSNYIRQILNKMSEEEFQIYLKYHLSTCERQDMIGAAAHTLDILKKCD